MHSAISQIAKRKTRPAFAMLMLLVVVAIGILIFYFSLNRPIDRETARIQKENPDKYPWVEEFRLLKEGQELEHQPSVEQPKLEEILEFEARVKKSVHEPRGQIYLRIRPDGRVKGAWRGEYDTASPRMNYVVIGADFSGNVDASKTYIDESGEDPSKLFIITKGMFFLLESNFENGKVRRVNGHIYVTGWVNTDYALDGKVTITSNKKTAKAFYWHAKPTKY